MTQEPFLDLLAEPTTSPVWRVGELTAQVRETLEANPVFADLWVQGEVSNSHTSAAGHTYFTLQDGSSRLACVLFRRRGVHLGAPEQGRLYVVRGSLSVYEAGGQYQLVVSDHRPAGIGDLFEQFQRLKARLEAEGLFDVERKRPLPVWPNRIGVVTSAQGAALQDLCRVVERRYPLVELVVAPSLVQGAEAPESLVRALESLNAQSDLDFIIVTRGGGSVEDLWAFNDEHVARAIAASRLPVVSAVGHEVDITITDGVADLRAPTPSAAGEMVVPDRLALTRQLDDMSIRMQRAAEGHAQAASGRLGSAVEHLNQSVVSRMDRAGASLSAVEGRLAALNPLAV
ncbi:MAG: exodeoxyribonuclease VII large subunit, partial [Dehalococcoidia bacterium]|nr:exodeoxyribonuclease VII large subunit [Dehalococcoidia bacterium]